jgi:hypothetical protein
MAVLAVGITKKIKARLIGKKCDIQNILSTGNIQHA